MPTDDDTVTIHLRIGPLDASSTRHLRDVLVAEQADEPGTHLLGGLRTMDGWPDKHLFAHDKRAYSHGCMRVENTLKYGEVLLSLALHNEH